MLGPQEYSILAVITNIIAIFGIPSLSLQAIIAKHTTELNIKKENGKIKGLFKYLTTKVLIVSLVSFLLFILISYVWLSNKLKIEMSLLILVGVFIFGAFLYPITAGILQGTKRFMGLGLSFTINCATKLIVGVALVSIGFGVYGATMGFITGIIVSFGVIFLFLRKIFTEKESGDKIIFFSNKNILIFLAITIFVLIYNIDVIFAKAFFTPEVAGKYAVASLISKIILFLTMAIGSVMFPINSERFINGKDTGTIFKKTVIITLAICGISLILFLLFPENIIKILFGEKYISISGILLYIGIAFSSISFLNILILNSISKNIFRLPQLFYIILSFTVQITFLSVFNKTIEMFSFAFMISSIIAVLGGLIFLKPIQKSF